jgi:DNA polymerase (family 10)
MVSAARARGYAVLALTDHAEGTVSGVDRQALLQQREHIRALQAELGDTLKLLHGVELNIGPRGELDYDAEFRKSFDFCIASLHSHFDLDQATQTARVVRAMEDPSVRMIGHLTARMIGGRAPVALDLDAVFAAAERTETALEVNGALPRLDVSVDVLRRAKDNRVTFVLSSDAHSTEELGLIQFAARNAERAGVDPARVANTWPAARLRDWALR